jgi:hypothetical protein
MNAAHYTAWWLRRRCLEAMVAETTAQGNAGDKEMDEAVEELYDAELAFALRISDENPKNYQVCLLAHEALCEKLECLWPQA